MTRARSGIGKRGAADSKRGTLTPGVYLGAPLLASRILHLGQITQVDPPVVGVCVGPDPSPFAAPLQHSCGLSQNQLSDLFGSGGRIRQYGRQRGACYDCGHGSILMRSFPAAPSSSNPDTA